jgi:hypothetical protein
MYALITSDLIDKLADFSRIPPCDQRDQRKSLVEKSLVEKSHVKNPARRRAQ